MTDGDSDSKGAGGLRGDRPSPTGSATSPGQGVSPREPGVRARPWEAGGRRQGQGRPWEHRSPQCQENADTAEGTGQRGPQSLPGTWGIRARTAQPQGSRGDQEPVCGIAMRCGRLPSPAALQAAPSVHPKAPWA